MNKKTRYSILFCSIAALLIISSMSVYYFVTNRTSPNLYRVFQDPEEDFTIFDNVAISNDGSLVAAGSQQSESNSWVKIWSNHTGKVLRTLQGKVITGANSSNPIAFAFSPDNKNIVIAQNEIKVWDIASGKLLRSSKLQAGTGWIVKFSDDGKMLACATQKNIIIWDWLNNKKPIIIHADNINVYAFDFSANGKFLISAGSEHKVKLWRVADGHLLKSHSEHHADIQACAFVNGNVMVSSLDQSGVNILWNIQNGKLRNLTEESGEKPQLLTIAAYSPDGKRYIRGISGTNVADRGYQNIQVISSLTGEALLSDSRAGSIYSLGFSNSSYFVTGNLSTQVKVWMMK